MTIRMQDEGVHVSTYIGRQPIFDQQGVCFGYELLYRSCDLNNAATFQDSAKATAHVIVNLIHNIGLAPIIGHKVGFVNVDETMLFSDAILLLPKEYFSFEILEHTQVSEALYARVKELHEMGYHFSLDDFDCSDVMFEHYSPIFPYIDIIKVDLQAIGIPHLEEAMAKLKPFNIPLLAEKIETIEEYTLCLTLDFTFFQGYFFEKPVILSGKRIEPNTLSALKLINYIQKRSDAQAISDQFSMCPDLVYNLLRHVNSGAYAFKQKIISIKQMVVLLGPKRILSWLGLFLYGTPHMRPFGTELFNNAKFRAKLMEELAHKCNRHELAHKAFLTGSLSLIDAYLSISMNEFLENVHLDDEINHALLNHSGFLGELLYIAIQMNHAIDVQEFIASLGHYPCFDSDELYDAYLKATIFVEETECDSY